MANYKNISGLRYSQWSAESDDPLLEQGDCRIEEMYYDERKGEIVLSFLDNQHPNTWTRSLKNGGYIQINHISYDKDTSRLHAVDVPIKASKKWNAFVDSLPKFDVPDQ